MVQYPIRISVNAASEPGIPRAWRSGTPHTERATDVAIPPEFKGEGQGFSPEDLYAMALLNCFVATFKVLAENAGLDYREIRSEGTLTVDRNEAGTPWMSKMEFRVGLELGANPDKAQAEKLLEKTSRNCLILNSVNTEKVFQFDVSTAQAAA